jgi:predicted ATPase with chaperone activity
MDGVGIVVPQAMQELGVRRSLVEDLALKILYFQGELTLVELADQMRVSFAVIEEVFDRLRKERLCEVTGMLGGVHRITTTSQGKVRALELLSLNQYSGPAPVSLEHYVRMVRTQSVQDVEIHEADVEGAFGHLVLPPETLTQLGTAIISGQSIFLYGPTGTGKTTVATAIPNVYRDDVWIPYAIEVDGQIVTIFDPHVHQPSSEHTECETDGRWVRCSRPRVVAGGELTIEMLDLQFNATAKLYSAPLQVKANNGVLIIDDFGRERMRPEELLNRWIVPLDRRVDFLSLVGGKKFEIPFDLFVVFATNLDPRKLADEAFLRRIQSKVKLDNMSPEEFREIFRRVCNTFGLAYDDIVVEELITLIASMNQPLRPCYARDLVQHICWSARYAGRPPSLDSSSVMQACRSYFVSS